MKVLRLPKNATGRDFVAGDIHGAFDLLWNAMKEGGFNRKQDRLLIPGDLIDRGPGSSRVAKFLKEPYVYASRGNHEQMLIDLYDSGIPDPEVIECLARMNINGMRWLKDTTPEQRLEIVGLLRELPIAIHVESDRGTYGLVHADVPKDMTWPAFLEKIEKGDKKVIDFALGMVDESRERIDSKRTDGVQGVGRVFVGHTIQKGGYRIFANVIAIDTAACFAEAGKMPGAHLTLLNANVRTGILAMPPQVAGNISVIDDDDQSDDPFSNIEEMRNLQAVRHRQR